MKTMALVLVAFFMPPVSQGDELEVVRKEPNLEKRSEKALDVASAAMKRARTIVQDAGTRTELSAALAELQAASELALQALKDTGKPPKKLGRQYKKGELRTRDLLKQLEDLIKAVGFEEREPAERVRDALTRIHDEFLLGVMGQSKT